MSELVFLKLGGSLITDKTRPKTARQEVIQRLASEICRALARSPQLRLVIGHGSGSFGHAAAQEVGYGRGNARTGRGFVHVARAAATLNRMVADALYAAGIPIVVLPPSVSARSCDGTLCALALSPFRRALESGLVPLTYGDVGWDDTVGWAIASTETVFTFLARHLRPQRAVLAGEVPGVLQFGGTKRAGQPIAEITPQTWPALRPFVGEARGMDVTGGMTSKVEDMLALATMLPGLQIEVLSGLEPGRVEEALVDETVVQGTRIRAGDC